MCNGEVASHGFDDKTPTASIISNDPRSAPHLMAMVGSHGSVLPCCNMKGLGKPTGGPVSLDLGDSFL